MNKKETTLEEFQEMTFEEFEALPKEEQEAIFKKVGDAHQREVDAYEQGEISQDEWDRRGEEKLPAAKRMAITLLTEARWHGNQEAIEKWGGHVASIEQWGEYYRAKRANGANGSSHLHHLVVDDADPDERRTQLPPVISKIRLFSFEQITLDCTQEEWTIKGITPREGLGVMWGPSGTYKSFIEIDQALRVALGWEYRGHRVQQGPVVYCAFEGGKGVYKRIEAWRRRFLPADYAEAVPFYLVPARLNMLEQAQELIDAIEAQTDGNTPVKITLDTLNRSMVGSENSPEDMSAYLAAADRLKEHFKCFVNTIHHPGWDTSRLRFCKPSQISP